MCVGEVEESKSIERPFNLIYNIAFGLFMGLFDNTKTTE